MKTITIRKPLLYLAVILLSLPLCVSAQDNYNEILKARNGNIGIGTGEPAAKLDILGGADHNGGNDPRAMAFQFRWGGYRHWIRTRHNGDPNNSATGNAFDFFLNNSSTADGSRAPADGCTLGMTITVGGVGVGRVYNPMAKLDILGGADQDGGNDPKAMAFQFRQGGYRHWIRTRHNGDPANSATRNAFDFFLNSSSTADGSKAPGDGSVLGMSITAGGVGVGGADNPMAKLDILGGSGNTGANGTPLMAFQYHDGGGYRHWIKTRHDGVAGSNKNAIDFYLNNSTTKDASSGPDPNSGSVHGMSITATGVGIGITTPEAKLQVEGGDIRVSNGSLRIRGSGSTGADIKIGNIITSSDYPDGGWIGTTNNYGLYIGSNNNATNMYLDTDDNVFIGFNAVIPAMPNARSKFDLFVHQGILTEDYALAPRSSWSDYVFDKEYQLKKLSEVEDFIQKNKHLPNIPSKEEIAKEGYSLHEVNVKLLEKIEELTLYAIEQEKEIKALKTQVNNYSQQEERIKALEEKMAKQVK